MAFFRKIKAGLVKDDISQFVGEEGNIFFNIDTGELRLSDGITPGGLPVAGTGGGGALPIASATVLGGIKVGENLTIAPDGTLNATGGGGTVSDTFNTIKVTGSPNLVALGLDTLEFIAGAGITISSTTSPSKQITVTASSLGNIDGGGAESIYGGLEVIDAGGI
jgi:hypothetical protein